MFDFSVFRIRDFSGAILGCVGMNCSYWPFMVYLPLYVTAGLGLDVPGAGLALLAYTVPFLVMPPVAQWLLLRHDARVVIPGGLFLIGLGFLLMQFGTHFPGHGVWPVLPGALLAGIGLGLTTTPATSMTTSAVPARRAGMASGMDVSARLITLALNIAVMGLVLVAGLVASLRASLGLGAEALPLRAVAERLAGGDTAAAVQALATVAGPDRAGAIVHTALAQGFGAVMLYGGVAVWITAALSWATFREAPAVPAGANTLCCANRPPKQPG